MQRGLPDRRRQLRLAVDRPADRHECARCSRPIARPAADSAVLLIHDGEHGAELIDAAARFSRGLPANVIPLGVNEVNRGRAGDDRRGVRLRRRARALAAARQAAARSRRACARRWRWPSRMLAALGYGDGAAATIETDDPDAMLEALTRCRRQRRRQAPATFAATGGKREILTLALRELHRVAPTPVDAVALPERRRSAASRSTPPAARCACPASRPARPRALTAGEDRPLLRFDESLCVQCGLCKATCPEKVITLEPRIAFKAFARRPRRCSRRRSRSAASPAARRSASRARSSRSSPSSQASTGCTPATTPRGSTSSRCARTAASPTVTNDGLDPYAAAPRPKLRTSEDYFAERERQREQRRKDEG